MAERDKTVRFTTLLHHVYNIDHLRAAYLALKRDAAAGIDGETWGHYGPLAQRHLGLPQRRHSRWRLPVWGKPGKVICARAGDGGR